MFPEWNCLPEEVQLALSNGALWLAAVTIAAQAEVLAQEMEGGDLADRGGPDALRLFAAIVRAGSEDGLTPVGHA